MSTFHVNSREIHELSANTLTQAFGTDDREVSPLPDVVGDSGKCLAAVELNQFAFGGALVGALLPESDFMPVESASCSD
ncbi:MAG: hypothetical protein R3C18_07000 [Planctomycetaceae bacterium]